MTLVHEKETAGGQPAAGGGVAEATNLRPQYSTKDAESQCLAELLATALIYRERGWSIIPLKPRSKLPAIPSWAAYQTRLPSEAELTRWFNKPANLAIVTGAVSGLVVLDVDGPEGEAEVKARGLPPTPMVRTGKGKHFYFRHPGGTVKNFARKLPGLDFRGDNGYVVAPPSMHESGALYVWEISPYDADLADLPAWLLELILEPTPAAAVTPGRNGRDPYAAAALAGELAALTGATEGTRNDQLNRSAYALGQLVAAGRLNRAEAERALTGAALGIGLGEAEARATIRSGLDSGALSPREPTGNESKANPGSFKCTDMGNAERFVSQHSDRVRYCHTWGKWLAWTGRRWLVDETGAVIRLAKETVRKIYAEAAAIEDDDLRKNVARWAHQSEAKTRLDALLALAQSEPGIPVKSDQLDRDPWLLNVANGTLDLRTGDLRAHAGGDLLTKYVPVEYDPGAQSPTWLAFLKRILAGNQNVIDFLQRAIGYGLTGDTSEQCMFLLYGTGANGKSTLLGTLGDLLGDYARQAESDTLLIKRSDSISNDVARLKGARLVTAVEVGDGRRLAEGLVKQMTGGDTITARFLHQEFFEFRPTFKIWLGTNHRPVIRGTDHAIWRRIRLIPFTVSIPEPEQDKTLPEKLRAELPGILAWAVRGCLDWQQRKGLGMPDEVKKATAAYRAEMDVIGAFLGECCLEEPNARCAARTLYEAYTTWCIANGEHQVKGTSFGRQLTERGFDRDHEMTGNVYVGLGLLTKELKEGK